MHALVVLRFNLIHPTHVLVLSCMPSLIDCALRSQKVTDKLLPATTADQLVTHIGMTLGEATELKLAASSAMPLSSAGGGTAAAVATVTGGVGSKLLGSPKPLVTSVSAARCPNETSRCALHAHAFSAAAAACCKRWTRSCLLQLQAAVRGHRSPAVPGPGQRSRALHLTTVSPNHIISCSNRSGCCWLHTAHREELLKQARWPSSRTCSVRPSSTWTSWWRRTRLKSPQRASGRQRRR